MNHLGVFAKYWQPGTVKTRLARSIGSVNAAGLYRDFIKQTLIQFSGTADTRSIWCWPADRQSEFERMGFTGWQVHTQAPGDLGEKMQGFFKSTLAWHSKVVLIGSDTPNLPVRLVEQAMEFLDTVDVVIGPSKDGGYYLIGMRTDACDLFRDINWSTPQVLDSTIERAKTGGHSYRLLDPWRDIDTIDDLIWLRQQLLEQACLDENTLALRGDIEAALNAEASNSTSERNSSGDIQS